jgi:hypothetical protein
VWVQGVSYRTWINDSIPDHVGRLLGYCIPAGLGTPEQRGLIAIAERRRPIPPRVRGSVTILKELGRVHNTSGLGWADPGDQYGAKIATMANRLVGVV